LTPFQCLLPYSNGAECIWSRGPNAKSVGPLAAFRALVVAFVAAIFGWGFFGLPHQRGLSLDEAKARYNNSAFARMHLKTVQTNSVVPENPPHSRSCRGKIAGKKWSDVLGRLVVIMSTKKSGVLGSKAAVGLKLGQPL